MNIKNNTVISRLWSYILRLSPYQNLCNSSRNVYTKNIYTQHNIRVKNANVMSAFQNSQTKTMHKLSVKQVLICVYFLYNR